MWVFLGVGVFVFFFTILVYACEDGSCTFYDLCRCLFLIFSCGFCDIGKKTKKQHQKRIQDPSHPNWISKGKNMLGIFGISNYNQPKSKHSNYERPPESGGMMIVQMPNPQYNPQYHPQQQQFQNIPQNQYNVPQQQYNIPQQQYNVPPQQNKVSQEYNAPQQQYNIPPQQYNEMRNFVAPQQPINNNQYQNQNYNYPKQNEVIRSENVQDHEKVNLFSYQKYHCTTRLFIKNRKRKRIRLHRSKME